LARASTLFNVAQHAFREVNHKRRIIGVFQELMSSQNVIQSALDPIEFSWLGRRHDFISFFGGSVAPPVKHEACQQRQ
jgi:hypothetical protein